MKYKKIMMLICLVSCILLTMSCAFANDALDETSGVSELDSQELQVNGDDASIESLGEESSVSVVYFNASAGSDGDGSQSNPYNTFKADRINYGTTAYFADGVYNVDPVSIQSSSLYKTTFIGQSRDKTILRSVYDKFDFTVSTDSYFVLKNMTLIGVHINNQANLVADNVVFAYAVSFDPNNPPALSYSYNYKEYNSSFGGVIICDTPYQKFTTLDLNNCQFISNGASSGGVIATYHTIADIRDCVFYNSSATRFGGAIYSESSNINIYNSYFELNKAKYGGVIYANCSNINLKNSLFNMSQSYNFGGVIASFSSRLDINHTFFDDYASLNDAGGAIYSVRGTLNVDDSSFKNGYSDFGGAICNLKTNSTINDSEFINNNAIYYGGSIYNMYGNTVLIGNMFINSSACSGGSIFDRISDSFKLLNNRFTKSAAEEGEIVFIDGNDVDVEENANDYDSSYELLKYGNIYDIGYYSSVPLLDYSAVAPDELPSSYDSRKYDYVTPAKDQVQGGNCWAFSGIATLEACIKKATGIAYDFSEENVKNLMSEYSMFGLDNEINAGGNLYMFIAYLAGWFGPIPDEWDVYDDFSSLSMIYDSMFHVQNVYVLPERENFFDNDYIKRAVMEYGAVSISIDLSENEGHAVTIVGWDDEFTANDFLDNKAVGAWIIKNSWGTSWGYDGFGYLSYQQPINFGYTFIFDDDRGYTDIYQYDFAGKSGYNSLNTSEVYVKNVFTAKNDELLSAFSTYFDEPTDFTAFVYLNGELVTTQNGYSERGYYTIAFDNEVSLNKGDTFEIVVMFSNPAPVYIPLCTVHEINKVNFEKGISFYRTEGMNWTDFYESNTTGVACIKAFTRLKTLTEISIDVNHPNKVYVDELVNIELDVPQYYVSEGFTHLIDGVVTFTINGQHYYASVENGKASLNLRFDKEGKYDVTIQYKSNRVVSKVTNFTINVEKTAQSIILLDAKDVSKFYGGSEIYVATVTEDGKAKCDANVKISVNGKDYDNKTDENGQVILDLGFLPVGDYDVRAQYGGKVFSSKFTVLTTISVNDITQDFWDSYISASFLNTDGKVLSDRNISFSIGYYGKNSMPIAVNATTNAVGMATAKVNLPVEKYLVTVVNPINGEEKQFVLEILPIDSSCTLSVTQLGSAVFISADANPVSRSDYVNFILLGKVYNANIVNGVATLRIDDLPIGDYNVTAIYSSNVNLRISSDTKSFSVCENAYKLTSYNYEGFYGASGTIANITDNGYPVQGEVVKATILNKTYYNITDEDGLAWFNLDLDVGEYKVLFEYNGQSLLKHVFVDPTITMEDSIQEYLNSKLSAHFIYPYFGEQPETLDVKFIVNGKEYATTTDRNGYASLDVNLPVGTHTVTAVNLCNGEHKQSKITVYKKTPTIKLTNSKRGDTLILTASLEHSSAIGNVVFTMGSKKYTAGVKDGKAILALNVLDEGNYEAVANYVGDSNFNNILSPVLKFNYARSDYALSAPEFSKYYGNPENFKINLTDSGIPVRGAVVTLKLGDKSYDLTTDSNGIATFDVNLNPGFYVVECDFEDKTVKSAITVVSTIEVNEAMGEVSYSKTSAKFYDVNGNPAKNKSVLFKIGNNEYRQTTGADGVATLDASLDVGNYNVTIVNSITGEIKYATLIITKANPTLALSFNEDESTLKATLPKSATGEVDFVLDNGDVYTFEVVGGISILEGIDPGEYSVSVNYKGDDKFNPVSKSIEISIAEVHADPLQSVLLSSKVTTTYGTSKNIVVTLKDSNGNDLVGRTVTVNLNNINYRATVQSNGQAKVAVPASLAVATYKATITYAGDEDVLGKSATVSVVVAKATPKLTAAKKTFKIKDKTKKYIVTLKTDKNKVYKNQKITVKVNGKTYSAKTNSKGQAIFKLTKLTKNGTFKATVKYGGNSYYKAVSKTVKLTVKK